MENTELAVGKELLSYCGKCKQPSAHVILNMKDKESVGKCQCNTCNAKHNYRDPEAVGKKKVAKKTRKSKASTKPVWKDVLEGATGEPKPYAMSGEFQEGDIVDHPTFGKGVVERLISNNKIETLFEQGSKILICAPQVSE